MIDDFLWSGLRKKIGNLEWGFGINNLLLCLLFFQLVNVCMGIFCVQGGCGYDGCGGCCGYGG